MPDDTDPALEAAARAIARRFWLSTETPDDVSSLPKAARHRREPSQTCADAYAETFWEEWTPEARAAIAAYERAKWRPIETAWRDGRFILAVRAGTDFIPFLAVYDAERGWIDDAGELNLDDIPPTHWQPPPLPPEPA